MNNSLGFPGILKGALIVRAKKITDSMAIAAAHSIADFSEKRGITPDNITAKMDETDVFVQEATDVALQAIKDGVARITLPKEEIYAKAQNDIYHARNTIHELVKLGLIKQFPEEELQEVLQWVIDSFKKS